MTRTRLVVVVGQESDERRAIMHHLMGLGHAAVVCTGPPGCSLVRDSHCSLLDVADCAVVMPPHTDRHDVNAQLALCARGAAATVVVQPSQIDAPADAIVVPSTDQDAVGEAVERAIGDGEPQHSRKGRSHVNDLWL